MLRQKFLLFLVASPLLLILAHTRLPPYYASLLTEIMIWALFAISFDLLFGYTGMLSFGQCLFFGTGAYGAALLLIHWNLPFVFATVAGPVCSGLLAFLVAPVIARVESHYFTIMTVLFALVALVTADGLSKITGGDDGLPVTVSPEFLPGTVIAGSLDRFMSFFVYVVTIMCIGFCWSLTKSPFGLALRGIRDNPLRAEFLGYPVRLYRQIIWVISGSVAGLAGALYVLKFHYVSTSYLHWTLSGEGVVWTIIGGKGTILGPIVGTAAFIYIKDTLSTWVAVYPLVVGALLIFLIHFAPYGFLGALKVKTLQRLIFRVVERRPETAKANSLVGAMEPTGVNTSETKCDVNESQAILEVRELSKNFGGIRAVDRVSLQLREKEAVVFVHSDDNGKLEEHHSATDEKIPDFSIVGPNAAGKSTLFNLLTGLLVPDSGTIVFKGQTLFEGAEGRAAHHMLRPDDIARMGLVRTFQHLNIFSNLTVYENLWLAVQCQNSRLRLLRPANSDQAVRRDVEEILGMTGLEEESDQAAGQLSFGRQKMLEIGLAIGPRPNLLLLDEPTAGVSPHETSRIISMIHQLSHSMGILIIEHDLEVVKALNFRTCVFGNGRIVYEGTPDDILASDIVQQHFLGSVA